MKSPDGSETRDKGIDQMHVSRTWVGMDPSSLAKAKFEPALSRLSSLKQAAACGGLTHSRMATQKPEAFRRQGRA